MKEFIYSLGNIYCYYVVFNKRERAYVLIFKLFKIEHITNSNNHHNYLIIYMRL